MKLRKSHRNHWAGWLTLCVLVGLGCGSQDDPISPQVESIETTAVARGDSDSSVATAVEADRPAVDPEKADYRILFFGNSHTAGNGLPALIAEMIRSDGAGEVAYVEYSGVFGFLDEAWQNPSTRPKIESLPWTHVVLQAQKYSQSGRYEYSTQEAVEMAQFVRLQHAQALFFPEWGQRGRAEEGARVHALHESIARQAEAQVAPVGLAWDAALASELSVELHSPDGNHATVYGDFLTAAVIYASVTGRRPEQINDSVMPEFTGPDRAALIAAAAKLTATKYPAE